MTWTLIFFSFYSFQGSFPTAGCVFDLSLILFCPSSTSHREPEELGLPSAGVPAQLEEGETTLCVVSSQPMGCHPKTKFKHMLFTECFHTVKIQLQFKTAS